MNPLTRRYAYKHALRGGRIDLDAERARAIKECYIRAVTEGYYPIAKPRVELETGSGLYPSTLGEWPTLLVSVDCLP